MIDLGQYIDFGDDVVNLLQLDDLALFQNLHRIKLLILLVQRQSHSAE